MLIAKIQKLMTQLANDYDIQTNLQNRDTFILLSTAELYKYFVLSPPVSATTKKKGATIKDEI